MSPVDNLLQTGLQDDGEFPKSHPLFNVDRYFLLVLFVLVLFGQWGEHQRSFLDDGLTERVQTLTILGRNILENPSLY